MKNEHATWMDEFEPPPECETLAWTIEPPSRPIDGVPQSTGQSSDSVPEERPHEPRGWLRNGNRLGDPSRAPRCGARNRRGLPCQCPAMKNGRCRLHGGLSTGAKTAEGLERIRKAVTKHGRYSARAKTLRRTFKYTFPK